MAKGKGKKGKKKKDDAEKDPNAVGEVDKTFYELQITDLNRKLARLRELTANLEDKNTELETKIAQLDEDRGDVIIFLKRQVSEKQNEAKELQERLVALQESKDSDEEMYEEKIKDMNEEYRIMKEQLTSEIKLITGKLNALEEFKIHRDELMQKFLDQEKQIEEQEIRHKRTLYEAEKMFIMSKDTIKREMEKRILEMAADFQQANEIRIASTTQRAIRENIALNNEMERFIRRLQQLTSENEILKRKNIDLRLNCDLYQTERNSALGNATLQKGIITQLRGTYRQQCVSLERCNNEVKELTEMKHELNMKSRDIVNLQYKIRVLEQNLHATKCKEHAAKHLLNTAEAKTTQLKGVLFEAIDAIEEAIEIRPDIDEAEKHASRETLLHQLFKLLREGKIEVVRCESEDTIETIAAAYLKGDLGFVPKPLPVKKQPPLKLHRDTQIGQSLTLLKIDLESDEGSPTPSPVESATSHYSYQMSIEDEYLTEETEEEEEAKVEIESDVSLGLISSKTKAAMSQIEDIEKHEGEAESKFDTDQLETYKQETTYKSSRPEMTSQLESTSKTFSKTDTSSKHKVTSRTITTDSKHSVKSGVKIKSGKVTPSSEKISTLKLTSSTAKMSSSGTKMPTSVTKITTSGTKLTTSGIKLTTSTTKATSSTKTLPSKHQISEATETDDT